MSQTANPTQPDEACLLRGIAAHWLMFARQYFPVEVRRQRLIEPVFALHEGSAWGLWRGRPRRELSLRRDLVCACRWDSVLEVLRHEMAHQVAEELFGAGQQVPHGPAFQRAAVLLKANGRASADYPLLEERAFAMHSAADDQGDRVLARVRKLLALATSPEPAEAELAMQKAQELLTRYQLDIVSAAAPLEEFFSVFLGDPVLRYNREKKILAAVLAPHFHVRALVVPAWVPKSEKMGCVVEISGRRVNVQSAHYAWDFVLGCIRRAWQQHKTRSRRQAYSGFMLGAVQGFADKLHAHQQNLADTLPTQALLPQADVRLDAWWHQRYPNVSTRQISTLKVDAHAYAKGREAGAKIVLQRGIATGTGKSGPIGLL